MNWIKEQFIKRATAIRAVFSREFFRLPFATKIELLRLGNKEKLILAGGKVFVSTFVPPLLSKPYGRYLKWAENFYSKKYLPRYLCICFTNQCLYNCEHCSNAKVNKGTELSDEEIIKVFDFFKTKGIFKVIFTGGEPLLRPSLIDVIGKLDKDSVFVAVCTSGFGLSLEKAQKLKESGLTLIKIGLDFSDQERNDDYKKFKGAYKNSIEAIKNSVKADLCVVVQTLLRRELLDEPQRLFDFVNFLEKLGVNELLFLEPKPCGNYFDLENNLSKPDKEKFYLLSKKINHSFRKIKCSSYFESEEIMGCMAGLGNFYLDGVGNIMPCVFAQKSFGNIKDKSLDEIYRNFTDNFKKPRKSCLSFDYKNYEQKKY